MTTKMCNFFEVTPGVTSTYLLYIYIYIKIRPADCLNVMPPMEACSVDQAILAAWTIQKDSIYSFFGFFFFFLKMC